MRVLIQLGSKGASIVDHLLTPLAMSDCVDEVIAVCRFKGPEIKKVKYVSPPGQLSGIPVSAIVYELLALFFLAIFRRPTLIIGYLLYPHGLMAFIAAKLTGRPVVISLIAGPFELYLLNTKSKVNYEGPLPGRAKFLLNILKRSNALVTTGSYTKKYLVKQGLSETSIFPMINPPNPERFYPVEVPKIYDIVSIGRLVPVKHNEVMLRCVAGLKNEIGDIKACIVGDGPCMPGLAALAKELNIAENIDFVGFQKNTPYYDNASRIFMLNSEREGFPNVFLEALSCGLPCIVSNCGDITDVARDGYNALVVPDYSNHLAFVEAVLKLRKDAQLSRYLSLNAIDTIRSLSAAEVTQQWERLFSKIGVETALKRVE